eukprot:gene11379-7885_t
MFYSFFALFLFFSLLFFYLFYLFIFLICGTLLCRTRIGCVFSEKNEAAHIEEKHTHPYLHTHVFSFIYIYIFLFCQHLDHVAGLRCLLQRRLHDSEGARDCDWRTQPLLCVCPLNTLPYAFIYFFFCLFLLLISQTHIYRERD